MRQGACWALNMAIVLQLFILYQLCQLFIFVSSAEVSNTFFANCGLAGP
jgi:hypothetical protein